MPRILKVESKDKGKSLGQEIEVTIRFADVELPLRSDAIVDAVNKATAPFLPGAIR